MKSLVYTHAFLICFYCTANSIRILVKPEILRREWPYNGNINFSRDWTDECDVPCIWTGTTNNIDGVFYMVKNNIEAQWAFEDVKLAPLSIGGSTEGTHYYPLLTNENFQREFNASALLDTGSDIPWIIKVSSYEEIQKIKPITDPTRKGVIATFNCASKNNREQIVRDMMKIFPIASIGHCLRNEKWPMCGPVECTKEEALRMYMFCLVIENGNTPGFVSEKIHQCFRAGSLPVWYGTKDVSLLIPKGSYIDIGDFKSHIEAAEYLLEVMNNVTLYNSYFEWKNHPLDPDYVARNKPFWDYKIQCRVCRYVSVIQRGLIWDKITQNAKIEDTQLSYSNEKSLNTFCILVLLLLVAVLGMQVYRWKKRISKMLKCRIW